MLKDKLSYLGAHGIKISEFSKMVQCAPITLSRWINGKSNVSEELEGKLDDAVAEWYKGIKLIMEE